MGVRESRREASGTREFGSFRGKGVGGAEIGFVSHILVVDHAGIGFVSYCRGTACRARTEIGFVLRIWVVVRPGAGELGLFRVMGDGRGRSGEGE